MHGFEKEARRIRSAFLKGDIPAMIGAVSDDMVRVFSIAGTPDECIKQLAAYRELIDLPVLSVPHYFLPPEQIREYQQAILETFGG
jgi:alkanesulfonate monooxygenase SsuD/methylene tetrahydromethanopterin reductase-like flavin-dependent oxidoreductase (luciferase family)